MKYFNLIKEKWIPVRLLDGQHETFGILDALLKSREIATIEDSSPLVVASLYRFLVALLYRALEGPTDIAQAKTLFKEGLSHQKIEDYLSKWESRFWLFHDEYPFAQIPSFDPKEWRAWTTLAPENNADNAKVFFDHINVNDPGSISEARAARGLLVMQTFALSSGKSELDHTSTAPSATAVIVFPVGESLEETLIYSLVPQDRENIKTDFALWEREPESIISLKSANERFISGFSDLYTWRSRSIKLQENSKRNVQNVAFASGLKQANKEFIDPMVAYRVVDKLGRLPLQFPERGLWREFDSILPEKGKSAPQTISHAINLLQRCNSRKLPSIMTLGQSNNKAKIDFWCMERFAFPKALVENEFIRTEIRNLLDTAEQNQKILWEACKIFVVHMITSGDRKIDPKDITSYLSQMICIPLFWTSMETEFHNILSLYSLDTESSEIECTWLKAIKKNIKKAWREHELTSSHGDVRTMRALSIAKNTLDSKLGKLSKLIKEYELMEVK